MQRVELRVPEPVCEANAPIEYLYFPTAGLLSMVSHMNDGSVIEVAAVGMDGAFGTEVFQGHTSIPYRCFAQVEGEGLRVGVSPLMRLAAERPYIQSLLLRYNGSLMVKVMQNAACNGLHEVGPRCCRWLLITRDRLGTDRLHLTHEFLGQMLGVRRASVSEVLKPLREAGLVDSNRGEIIILDAHGLEERACECYRRITDAFAWLR